MVVFRVLLEDVEGDDEDGDGENVDEGAVGTHPELRTLAAAVVVPGAAGHTLRTRSQE